MAGLSVDSETGSFKCIKISPDWVIGANSQTAFAWSSLTSGEVGIRYFYEYDIKDMISHLYKKVFFKNQASTFINQLYYVHAALIGDDKILKEIYCEPEHLAYQIMSYMPYTKSAGVKVVVASVEYL
jgi:hypothetical protein